MYLHCISKENFIAWPRDLSCVELVCPEVHVSFMDKMAERRVALSSQHGRFVFFSKYSGTCVIENKLRFDSKNDSYISKTMQSMSVRLLLQCMLTPCLQISLVLWWVIQELHLLLLRFWGILISFLHQWQLLFAQRRLQIANRSAKLIHLWISMLHLASFDSHWDPGDKHGEGIVDPLRDLLINSGDEDDESDSDHDMTKLEYDADTSHSTE